MNLRKRKKLDFKIKLSQIKKSVDTVLQAVKDWEPDEPKYNSIDTGMKTLECYMCKALVEVGPVGKIKHWRLDCSHCANREKVVSLTSYIRQEVGRSSFTEFSLKEAEIFFKIKEEDSTTFAWKFDFINNKTACKRIELDVNNPVVAIVDSILPITLENMRSKVKLAMVFG